MASSGVHRLLKRRELTTFTNILIQTIVSVPFIMETSSLVFFIRKSSSDEVFNLTTQSHVAVLFEEPEYRAESDSVGVLRLFEVVRILGLQNKTKVYVAGPRDLVGQDLCRKFLYLGSSCIYPSKVWTC